MGLIRIDLRTDIRPDEIDHVDIHLIDERDERENRFHLIDTLGGDLVRGERIHIFEGLRNETVYGVHLRLFLRQGEPSFRHEYLRISLGERTCTGRLWWRRCTDPRANANFVIAR